MQLQLLILTVGPALAIALFVYLKDKYDPEPFKELVKAFFWGVAATFPIIVFELNFTLTGLQPSEDFWETMVHAFLGIALIEEGTKFYFLKKFYRKEVFDEPFDGIVYAVMIAMGFAATENIFYVFFLQTEADSYATALMRMLTAIPAHASFAVLMGYFVGLSKFRPEKRVLLQVYGVLTATFFHGSYDFLLLQQNYPNIAIGAFISLGVSIWLAFRAMRRHQNQSPFKDKLF